MNYSETTPLPSEEEFKTATYLNVVRLLLKE